MAEYVTLKKPDGTVIYPQSVIAQVADGSITTDMIDWSTLPGRIIAVGQIDVGNISANSGKEATEYIPTQTDSNYAVILTHAAQVNGYDKCMPAVKYKYTNRFVVNVWNSGSSSSGNILLDYVAIKY